MSTTFCGSFNAIPVRWWLTENAITIIIIIFIISIRLAVYLIRLIFIIKCIPSIFPVWFSFLFPDVLLGYNWLYTFCGAYPVSWNHSKQKTGTHLSCIVSTMASDVLTTLGTRASASMILTYHKIFWLQYKKQIKNLRYTCMYLNDWNHKDFNSIWYWYHKIEERKCLNFTIWVHKSHEKILEFYFGNLALTLLRAQYNW